jgi:hypothetical protein
MANVSTGTYLNYLAWAKSLGIRKPASAKQYDAISRKLSPVHNLVLEPIERRVRPLVVRRKHEDH